MFKHAAKYNESEFTELLRPVYESLYRFARAMARNHHETQDLVSETLVQALESFHTLKDKQSFLSFLFTIAVRIHNKRRRKIWRLLDFRSSEEIDMNHSGQASPELSAELRILYEALDRLAPKVKEAVVLFSISDLSLEEIRQIQGGSLSGVKSRVTRGRRELAELLRERGQSQSERFIDAQKKIGLDLSYQEL